MRLADRRLGRSLAAREARSSCSRSPPITGLLARWVRAFAEDRNTRSARFFRMVNEMPALLMIAIVILVVVKPF